VGSALIAALMHRRRAMGAEQQLPYVELAYERLSSYLNGTLNIRPLGRPVYQPTGREKVSRPPEEWGTSAQERLLEPREEYE
jgi:adenine-specific DNA-methyltransferase